MPGCVFSVSGSDLDLNEALALLSFTPYRTHRKGDPIDGRPGHFYEASSFSVMASEASGHELWRQLEEADSFLTKHEKELTKIVGIEVATLDFGYYCRLGSGTGGNKIVVQGEHIQSSLLKRCGDLEIGISLSLYPASDDDTENNTEQGDGGNSTALHASP